MRAKKLVPRIGDSGKEFGPPQRIIARPFGDDRAQPVSLELKILGIGACAELRPQPLRVANGRGIPARKGCKTRKYDRARDSVLLLPADVARDVMGRFMAQNKGQFVFVAGTCDQCQRERHNRASATVQSLKGICRLTGTVIDNDLEIAIHPGGARPALAFSHWFDNLHDPRKTARGLRWRQGWAALRRGRGAGGRAGLDRRDLTGCQCQQSHHGGQ